MTPWIDPSDATLKPGMRFVVKLSVRNVAIEFVGLDRYQIAVVGADWVVRCRGVHIGIGEIERMMIIPDDEG